MANTKKQLEKSKKKVNNEYYTLLEDIENELKNYWPQLEGKKIWCNCDDPEWSEFHHYFKSQKAFHKFEVKYTHYNLVPKNKQNFTKKKTKDVLFERTEDDQFIKTNEIWVDQDGFCQGDFRAKQQDKLWKWADVIITNPPFSLFREFIEKIMKEKKKFLVIGPQNAVSYKNIFNEIKNNNIWIGYNFHLTGFWMINEKGEKSFLDSKKENGAVPRACCWYTNLEVENRKKKIILTEEYSKEKNPFYKKWIDGLRPIYIKSSNEIPCDYFKEMAVPITFIHKYNPDQFEILDLWAGSQPYLEKTNKRTYARIIIKRKDK